MLPQGPQDYEELMACGCPVGSRDCVCCACPECGEYVVTASGVNQCVCYDSYRNNDSNDTQGSIG